MLASKARFRWLAWLALVVVCSVGLTGCVSETHVGDKTTFTMQWWVPLTVMLVSLIAGPAGFLLRESSTRLAFGLMIACPFGFLFGISLFTDYCEVDPSGFKGRGGFFGSKTFEGNFDDIAKIVLVTERSRRSSSVKLIYHTRDGKQHNFSLGDQMTEKAALLILSYAQDKGIPIIDNT
jgi:hypothetical protein